MCTSCQDLLPSGEIGRTIFIVSEFEHELVAGLGVLRKTESLLLCAGRKAVVGEGGSYDVEGRGLFTAIGEERKNLGDFDEAAGP